jgi:type II secretory pathway component PulC
MYNKKILLGILSALLIAETVINYEVVFAATAKTPKKTIYRSMGIVDKFYGKVSAAKYINAVELNIFSAINNNIDLKKENNVRVVTQEFALDVKGVMITSERRTALLWDKKEKKSYVVDEGETIKTWLITSVLKDRVVISSNGKQKEIYVNKVTGDGK